MFERPILRALVAPLALIGLVGAVGAAVERYAAPPGGLQLPVAHTGKWETAIRTGPLSYPRAATDADGIRVRIARPANRIASQYFSIDDFVYSVVEPDHVIAVSANAYLPAFSNVLAYVQRFHPAISTDPERVLRLDPDLILVSSDGRADYTSLVRSSGVPLYRMQTSFHTLREVAETIRLIGYLTGADEAARREGARFESTIANALALRPKNADRPRVLGIGGGYGYGDETLFSDIVTYLGGVNVAAEAGLKGYDAVSSEQIVRWNPEWIVTGSEAEKTTQVLAKLLADPAIATTEAARKRQIVVLDDRIFLPMSPFTSRLVVALAHALYAAPHAGAGA